MVDLYLSVHAVEGVTPGAYVYHPDVHALELIKPGDFRRESAFLCLDQPLGGMSATTVFFLANLAALLDTYGNRGYRVANLEAGLIGGRSISPPTPSVSAPPASPSTTATWSPSSPPTPRAKTPSSSPPLAAP